MKIRNWIVEVSEDNWSKEKPERESEGVHFRKEG